MYLNDSLRLRLRLNTVFGVVLERPLTSSTCLQDAGDDLSLSVCMARASQPSRRVCVCATQWGWNGTLLCILIVLSSNDVHDSSCNIFELV